MRIAGKSHLWWILRTLVKASVIIGDKWNTFLVVPVNVVSAVISRIIQIAHCDEQP